jgi:hypothetical protein
MPTQAPQEHSRRLDAKPKPADLQVIHLWAKLLGAQTKL